MTVQSSGRVLKYLVDPTGSVPEGRTLDKLQLFLPDGTALDLENLGGGEEVEPVIPFLPQGAWAAGEYVAGSAVIHDGEGYTASYWTPETTSEEPGLSAAPLVDGVLQTSWLAEGAHELDSNIAWATVATADGSPFDDETAVILYFPITTAGHVNVAIECARGHDFYIGTQLIRGSDMSEQGSGTVQDDGTYDADMNTTGDWYIGLRYSGSSIGTGTFTATISTPGATVYTPPPEDVNPWIRFAE